MPQDELLIRRSNGDLLAWNVSLGSTGFQYLLNMNGATTLLATDNFDNRAAGDEVLFEANGGGALFNPRTGTFAAVPIFAGLPSARGDFQDGPSADIAVMNDARDLVTYSYATGSFVYQFRLEPDYSVAGGADMDGDGRDEVILRRTNGAVLAYEPLTGQFIDLITLDPMGPVRTVAAANFTGSQAHDVIFYNQDTGAVTLWDVSRGADGFVPLLTLETGWMMAALDGDFDGDGYNDLVFLNSTGRTVLFGTSAGFSDITSVISGNVIVGIGDVF